MSAEYFSHLAKSMAASLSDVISEESSGLFRRAPQVLVGTPMSEMSTDYHLFFLGKEFLDQDSGSFTTPNESGNFHVFRNPIRMRASFLLLGNGLLSQNKMKTYDRLLSHFFDKSRVDPFIPEGFKKFAPLYERLMQTKAEVVIRGDLSSGSNLGVPGTNGFDMFRMVLDYSALYHSGSLLREETRVKSRVIDYGKNLNERSVL